jgi:hypothetical protein
MYTDQLQEVYINFGFTFDKPVIPEYIFKQSFIGKYVEMSELCKQPPPIAQPTAVLKPLGF